MDATGDGEFCALADVPFEIGRGADGLLQSMTMLFRMPGADWERITDYFTAHPHEIQHEARWRWRWDRPPARPRRWPYARVCRPTKPPEA